MAVIYYKQFEGFNPLVDDLPTKPFTLLPVIANRARNLLPHRTREQAIAGANQISWIVSKANDKTGSHSVTHTENLRAVLNSYNLDSKEFPQGKQFEYFAILSLWRIVDTVRRSSSRIPPEIVEADSKASMSISPSDYGTKEEYFRLLSERSSEELRKLVPFAIPTGKFFEGEYQRTWFELSAAKHNLALAADYLAEAMDAVCWAEHLKQIEDAVITETRKRISLNASAAAIKRHAETNGYKEEVRAWYEKSFTQFRSLDAAARSAEKIVPVTFRTARKWIGEIAKDLHSARRM